MKFKAEKLTGKDLEGFINGDLPAEAAGIFPNFSALAKVVPTDELYAMVVNRLKNVYQSSMDNEAVRLHPYVMRFLAPFLKDRMYKRNTAQRQAIQLPEKFSQIKG